MCALFECGAHCQCDAKGGMLPRTGHRQTDRPTGRFSCRPVYWPLKKPYQKSPMHLFLLGKNLDHFRSTFPSYSILRIKLKMYGFQSVLHNMPLIVWSKVAFSFVEWRRQMSLRPRMLVLSARYSAEMWSVLPGAQWSVIFSKTVSCWCRHYVNIIAYVWD